LRLKVEHRGGGLHDQDHQGLEAHIAEVTALCSDKQVIRVRFSGDDMYASLDKLSDRLGRKLRKYKERKRPRSVLGARQLSNLETQQPPEEEGDELELSLQDVAEVEPGTVPLAQTPWQVVRKKSFPMPPISVDEAVLCLEYIDHDFYVFQNAETNKINVVYKRNSGDVGLIEPEQVA
jgi:putative sigma-54 modulation protein